MQKITFRAMGCGMQAILDSDEPGGAKLLESVPVWFEEWEARLSRFREDSELCALNSHAGQPVRVSVLLWEVLQRAAEAVAWSDGLVVPTMLNELLAAGYTRSFESGDGRQAGDAPAQTSTAVRRPPSAVYDWRGIEWSSYNRTVCLPSGVRLDLGGIAKGWAADEAVRRLGSYAAAMVDAGGDITVSGPMSGGGRWPIGMANPLAPDEALEVLMLEGGAVATSGKDYRKWQVNGEWKHHILDPRTGQPAETDVLSATVIAPTACEAEVAAKIAFIKGSRDGMAWLEDQPQLAGLLVLEDGTVLRSSRVEEYVKRKGKGKKAKRKT